MKSLIKVSLLAYYYIIWHFPLTQAALWPSMRLPARHPRRRPPHPPAPPPRTNSKVAKIRPAQIKMEQEAKDNAAKGDKYRADYTKQKGVKKTANGVLYKVDKAGTGSAPTDSDTVAVNYKGTLVDGTEFDNSYKRGEPMSFHLDGVIPGWTEGLKHIKKGGKIQLVIPPEQAYDKTGVSGIPANSTLVFDVELLDIKPARRRCRTGSRRGRAAKITLPLSPTGRRP